MHTAPKEKCNAVCLNRISRVFRIGGGGTAAFHATVRGSAPGLGGLKKQTKMFLTHPRVKLSIVESLRDREVACSASVRQGSNRESCVWRTVSSHSSHHPHEVLMAQFSLYVLEGGLSPDSFHFISFHFVSYRTLDQFPTHSSLSCWSIIIWLHCMNGNLNLYLWYIAKCSCSVLITISTLMTSQGSDTVTAMF